MSRAPGMMLLALTLAVAACSGDDNPTRVTAPTPTPPPPPPPACQANTTAQVRFGNRSAGTTYTVSWDGATVATLGPGQDSEARTVAAGVAHQLIFRVANTTRIACGPSSPIPATCSTVTHTCSAP